MRLEKVGIDNLPVWIGNRVVPAQSVVQNCMANPSGRVPGCLSSAIPEAFSPEKPDFHFIIAARQPSAHLCLQICGWSGLRNAVFDWSSTRLDTALSVNWQVF